MHECVHVLCVCVCVVVGGVQLPLSAGSEQLVQIRMVMHT